MNNQSDRAILIENEDFQRVTIFLHTLGGRQESVDYAISLSAAKEIAMLSHEDN